MKNCEVILNFQLVRKLNKEDIKNLNLISKDNKLTIVHASSKLFRTYTILFCLFRKIKYHEIVTANDYFLRFCFKNTHNKKLMKQMFVNSFLTRRCHDVFFNYSGKIYYCGSKQNEDDEFLYAAYDSIEFLKFESLIRRFHEENAKRST